MFICTFFWRFAKEIVINLSKVCERGGGDISL